MISRAVWVLLAAVATMSSGHAADLGGGMAQADGNCVSNMITVYDVEPGVVTRRWGADCNYCRHERYKRRFQRAATPVMLPDYAPFAEPWRRYY